MVLYPIHGTPDALSVTIFLCPQRNLGRHIKIAPSMRSFVRPSVRYKSCLSDSSYTTEANLMKLHRKIKHNEKESIMRRCVAHMI